MPRVHEIVVSAGRTFNHPYESYSNLKPGVTVKAELLDGEDWESVAKELQAKAEQIVEDHKRHLLKSLEEIETMTRKAQQVSSLNRKIRDAQADLDRLRTDAEYVPAIEGPNEDDNEPF